MKKVRRTFLSECSHVHWHLAQINKTITGSMNESVKTMFHDFTGKDCYKASAIQDCYISEEKIFDFCTADCFNDCRSSSSVQRNTFFVEIIPEAKQPLF